MKKYLFFVSILILLGTFSVAHALSTVANVTWTRNITGAQEYPNYINDLIGIGTSSPSQSLSVSGNELLSGSLLVTGTATSTFVGGISVIGGCVSVSGTCLGSGGGANYFTNTGSTTTLTTGSILVSNTIVATSTTGTSRIGNFTISGNLIKYNTTVGFQLFDLLNTGIYTDGTGNTFIGDNNAGANVWIDANANGHFGGGERNVGIGCDFIGGDCGQVDLSSGYLVAGTWDSGATESFGGCDNPSACPITTVPFGDTMIGQGTVDGGYSLNVDGTGISIGDKNIVFNPDSTAHFGPDPMTSEQFSFDCAVSDSQCFIDMFSGDSNNSSSLRIGTDPSLGAGLEFGVAAGGGEFHTDALAGDAVFKGNVGGTNNFRFGSGSGNSAMSIMANGNVLVGTSTTIGFGLDVGTKALFENILSIGSTSASALLSAKSNSKTEVLYSFATSTKTLSWLDAKGDMYTGGDNVSVTSCGATASSTSGSNNNAGRINVGTTALQATCTVNFADGGWTSTSNPPSCSVQMEGATALSLDVAVTQTSLVVTPTSGNFPNKTFGYSCTGF